MYSRFQGFPGLDKNLLSLINNRQWLVDPVGVSIMDPSANAPRVATRHDASSGYLPHFLSACSSDMLRAVAWWLSTEVPSWSRTGLHDNRQDRTVAEEELSTPVRIQGQLSYQAGHATAARAQPCFKWDSNCTEHENTTEASELCAWTPQVSDTGIVFWRVAYSRPNIRSVGRTVRSAQTHILFVSKGSLGCNCKTSCCCSALVHELP